MVTKIYLFKAPKRYTEREEYEISILEKIGEKFRLGELLDYDVYYQGDIAYLKGRFSRGKVMAKFVEGGEAIALLRTSKVRVGRFK
ncbi:MAG: hypothetical protein ASUL_07214 [Candidatus Aramenus sulfurataquae]|jgi:hypothetical protein|uniref:Uncharacterized protein n=2 Tax=Candidatus Aramenus sulfurataquae TaxID=1326980 RepID=W7L5R3_9CREN|nr:MAG: hypothetical protein ASUL_07214 [Candidatus Aramenus sulfurataquae]MCL7343565.1 hypothetical protein [Candidatus Aramenus sulfurataquae]